MTKYAIRDTHEKLYNRFWRNDMMTPKELKDNEKKVLAWIEKAGAISPSQLAAETQILPQEMWEMINQLAERDLVMLRDDPDSVDGKLIFAAPMSKAASKIQAKPDQDEP